MTEETASQEKKSTAVAIRAGNRGLELTTLDDIWRFAGYVVLSGFAPKGMEKKESIAVSVAMGLELGLSPMQAIQNIAVINGRPSVWGDAVPGLVDASGLQETGYPEKIGQRNADGSYPDSYGYRYTTRRRGRKEYSYDFTVADAKKAGLWGKTGPWTAYPDRMLLNRARTFCLRDAYPDILKGLHTVEESRDMQEAEFEVVEKPHIDLDESAPVDTPAPAADPEPAKRTRKKKEEPALETNDAPAQNETPEAAPTEQVDFKL